MTLEIVIVTGTASDTHCLIFLLNHVEDSKQECVCGCVDCCEEDVDEYLQELKLVETGAVIVVFLWKITLQFAANIKGDCTYDVFNVGGERVPRNLMAAQT